MPTVFRLEEILEGKGMTQSDLARRSGISLVTINRMCRNQTQGVSLDTLDKLAAVLEVQPGDVITSDKPAKRRGK